MTKLIAILAACLFPVVSAYCETSSIRYISRSTEMLAMAKTADGGIVLSGDHWDGGGDTDPIFISVDPSGKIRWTRIWDGEESDFGNSVSVTASGNVFAGMTTFTDGTLTPYGMSPNMMISKLDPTGKLLWQRTIGGDAYLASSVAATADGGVVTTGQIGRDYWNILVLRLSATGNVLWAREVPGHGDAEGSFIMEARDGSYLLGGYTYDGAVIFRLDRDGSLRWAKLFPELYQPVSIVETGEGDLIFSAVAFRLEDVSVAVVKLNRQGEPIWGKGFFGFIDIANLNTTSNGELLLAGQLDNKALFVKLAPDARILWKKNFAAGDQSRAVAALEARSGEYFFAGGVDFYNSETPWSPLFFAALDAHGKARGCNLLSPATIKTEKVSVQAIPLNPTVVTNPKIEVGIPRVIPTSLHLGAQSACRQ